MKYVFEEDLENKIVEGKKLISEYIDKYVEEINIKENSIKLFNKEESLTYLLAMLLKEDSLLNCLTKIKIGDYLEHSVKIICDNCDDKHNDDLTKYEVNTSTINDMALRIANVDNNGIITDEHLLYSILKNKSNIGNIVLESFTINTDTMLETVIEYLELENDLYLENISEKYRNNKVNNDEIYVGGEKYINKIIRILNKKQKNNCMIIGSAGIGKSALVKEVSKRLVKIGFKSDIYKLDVGALVAGTRYRGDLEERITQVISKVKDNNGILFIDEIHMLTSHTKSEETLNMSNLLKPILSENEIKCIGTTTTEEYYEYIDKDRAFARRFQNIIMAEPNEEETKEILLKVKPYYEKYYGIKYSKTIIDEIVKSSRYYPNRKNPDKSIDILDETGSYVFNNNQKFVRKKDIKHVIFENICLSNKYQNIDNKKIKNTLISYQELIPFYKKFIEISNDNKEYKNNILNVNYQGVKIEKLINEIKILFGITDEEVIILDLEFIDNNMYSHLLHEVLKNPLMLIIINNYEKASFQMQRRILHLMKSAKEYNDKGQEVSFRNTIFIINGNKRNGNIGYDINHSFDHSYDHNIGHSDINKETNIKIVDLFIKEK